VNAPALAASQLARITPGEKRPWPPSLLLELDELERAVVCGTDQHGLGLDEMAMLLGLTRRRVLALLSSSRVYLQARKQQRARARRQKAGHPRSEK